MPPKLAPFSIDKYSNLSSGTAGRSCTPIGFSLLITVVYIFLEKVFVRPSKNLESRQQIKNEFANSISENNILARDLIAWKLLLRRADSYVIVSESLAWILFKQ